MNNNYLVESAILSMDSIIPAQSAMIICIKLGLYSCLPEYVQHIAADIRPAVLIHVAL